MLDIWESCTSSSKSIKIGWWIAVVIVILLIYRRLAIDLTFIIIGFVACIIYLFSFAADNGAEVDPNPIHIILAWIILVSLIFILTTAIPYGSLITLFLGMISLIIIVVFINYIPAAAWILVILAIILAIVNLIINGSHSVIEFSVAILVIGIVVILAGCHQMKESLLILTILGLIIGLLPAYSQCSE